MEELQKQLEMFKLLSPVNGIVERLEIEAGEASKINEEHIRIVSVTPLWLEVPVPLAIARKLKKSSVAKVFFQDLEKFPKKAEVLFISPVADTASDTVRVKLQLTNKDQRLAGERVKLLFEGVK